MLAQNFITHFIILRVHISISKKTFEQCSFALFIAFLYMLIFGYQYNSGDQSEHLPQVYQNLNPALFPNDFFLTLYHKTFTVRFYWVELVTFLSNIFSVNVVCFVLYLSCLSFCILACMKISEHIFQKRGTSYLFVFIVFMLFNRFTVGGNQLQGTIFVGSNIAEVFACFGILFFIKEQYNSSAIFFAIASLFQVLVGFQLWLLFSGLLLFSKKNNHFQQLFLFSIIYLVTALPILFPLIRIQFFNKSSYDEQMYYKIVYVYRSILHFKPTLFPVTDYLKMLFLLIPSVVILWKRDFQYKRMFVVLFVLIVSGAIVYTLLVDVLDLNVIGKIQWFKTTVWLNLFCCLLIADWLVKLFGNFLNRFQNFTNSYVLITLSFCILIVITQGKYLPLNKLKTRYQIGNFQQSDLQLTHEWIKNNMPVDAVFLVSPQDDAFACEAQRSQPVNYKAVVHEPFYFMEWYKTMHDYYNVDFEKVGNNAAISQAENNYQTILKYPENNSAQFRIDNLKQSKITSQLGKIIFKQGSWIVTKINKK